MEKNYGFENFLAVFTPLPNKKKKDFLFLCKFNALQ
jgi:hypothetical protein